MPLRYVKTIYYIPGKIAIVHFYSQLERGERLRRPLTLALTLAWKHNKMISSGLDYGAFDFVSRFIGFEYEQNRQG